MPSKSTTSSSSCGPNVEKFAKERMAVVHGSPIGTFKANIRNMDTIGQLEKILQRTNVLVCLNSVL